MAAPEDLLQADVDRVYGEYFAAREVYERTAIDDDSFGLVAARFNDAERALHETRGRWREIGVVTGVRLPADPLDLSNRDTRTVANVKTTDDDGSEPDQPTPEQEMVGEQWTGRRYEEGTA